MHVLFVSDGDNKYGASLSMKQLISGMLEYCEDIEISVVLPLRVNLEDYYHQLGCNVYRIPYEPFYQGMPEDKWKIPIKFLIRGIEYLIGKWFAPHCLSKKLDMNTIDIIHSNSSREDFGAALALKYRKPLVWHIREFGDKDYRCFSYRKDYIQLMNMAATKFIAVSDAVKEHWIKKGLNSKKLIRIYDSVTVEAGENFLFEKDKSNEIRLIMLGHICETKGQYQIIQALGMIPEKERKRVTIDFIGGGVKSYIKKLTKEIEKKGLSNIISFLGYQENFQRNIGQYDCGIVCSKSEGFGRVTIEYMQSGLPVIASNTGANTELIIDYENGFLYEWNNIVDLRDKIILILKDRKKIMEMGENAKLYAQSHFSAQSSVELIYKEYLSMIKNNSEQIGVR